MYKKPENRQSSQSFLDSELQLTTLIFGDAKYKKKKKNRSKIFKENQNQNEIIKRIDDKSVNDQNFSKYGNKSKV